MSRRLAATALLFLLLTGVSPAQAGAQDEAPRFRVVVTLPYLGELVKAIGGDLVQVEVLFDAGQDPHDVQVAPGMTASLKQARLFVENGMTLESCSPRLLASAGQSEILPGKSGHCYASDGIVALERPDPATLAAGGHIHAAGNPHVWLDPINLKVMARNVEKALGRSLFQYRDDLATRRAAFEARIDEAMFGAELVKLLGGQRLEKLHRTGELAAFLDERNYRGEPLARRAGGWWRRARDLPTRRFVSFHRTWSYLERAFALEIVGTLEEKPGIPPSPAHLEHLARVVAEQGVAAVIAPPYYPRSRIDGFAEKVGLLPLVLPSQPGEAGAPSDLFGFYDRILDLLATAGRR
ncbi:MAG: zinc ABC transporter substrate-binding protein [Planctomycetes bacterium]|nr:zinc ABC transporter substrate-binding protein [Planctomycetota bacterium]